jgi:hypothetical protein
VPCAHPVPSPTSHLGALELALVSQLIAQGYSLRNHKIDIMVHTQLWSSNKMAFIMKQHSSELAIFLEIE